MQEAKRTQFQVSQQAQQRMVLTEPQEGEVIIRRQIPKGSGRQSQGLCATCVHQAGCTFPRRSDEPVFQCAEFEGELAPVVLKGAIPVFAQRFDESEASGCQAKGLCRTCSKRLSCLFPKPEGGVWHCEEYE